MKPLIQFDMSANDLHTSHNEKRYMHSVEEVQLKPDLVHRG